MTQPFGQNPMPHSLYYTQVCTPSLFRLALLPVRSMRRSCKALAMRALAMRALECQAHTTVLGFQHIVHAAATRAPMQESTCV